MNNMTRRLIALLLTLSLAACATPPAGQTSGGEGVIRNYAGIGRISWQLARSTPTAFAVPHFTAGPRLVCQSGKIECEIDVVSRDISISPEERTEELKKQVQPHLPNATVKTFQVFHHGKTGAVTYTTLEDNRPGEQFRFLTIGFATRGTAVIKFHALTNDAMDYVSVLNIVYGAKALDAREMWALRFADYNGVCAERYPDLAEANAQALQRSNLSKVDLVEFLRRGQPDLSNEAVAAKLLDVRKGYARSFDLQPSAKRRQFCESMPEMLATAVSERQAIDSHPDR
jgi:hypothetical protein